MNEVLENQNDDYFAEVGRSIKQEEMASLQGAPDEVWERVWETPSQTPFQDFRLIAKRRQMFAPFSGETVQEFLPCVAFRIYNQRKEREKTYSA